MTNVPTVRPAGTSNPIPVPMPLPSNVPSGPTRTPDWVDTAGATVPKRHPHGIKGGEVVGFLVPAPLAALMGLGMASDYGLKGVRLGAAIVGPALIAGLLFAGWSKLAGKTVDTDAVPRHSIDQAGTGALPTSVNDLDPARSASIRTTDGAGHVAVNASAYVSAYDAVRAVRLKDGTTLDAAVTAALRKVSHDKNAPNLLVVETADHRYSLVQARWTTWNPAPAGQRGPAHVESDEPGVAAVVTAGGVWQREQPRAKA